MDPFKAYAIPLKSLRNGVHQFKWQVGASFFDHFEASPIRRGQFEVEVLLDKQEDLSTIQMMIKGSYHSVCDRCLAAIDIPVQATYNLYVKTGTDALSDPSLICISPEETELKLADVIYEYICLSRPISQTIDCAKMENPPCDREVLDRIQTDNGPQYDPSIWEGLKNFESN